jgi:hypothetical protein
MDMNAPKFGPRWNEGFLVPICIPVQEIPAERNEIDNYEFIKSWV